MWFFTWRGGGRRSKHKLCFLLFEGMKLEQLHTLFSKIHHKSVLPNEVTHLVLLGCKSYVAAVQCIFSKQCELKKKHKQHVFIYAGVFLFLLEQFFVNCQCVLCCIKAIWCYWSTMQHFQQSINCVNVIPHCCLLVLCLARDTYGLLHRKTYVTN